MNLEFAKKEILKKEFNLSERQIEKIEIFSDEIIKKNKIINLLSRKEEENIYERHILDSLQFINLLKELNIKNDDKLNIVDIGSGGGFPGVILAIALPDFKFTLTEKVYKKYSFLIWMKEKLNLYNMEIINQNIDGKGNLYEKFDIATERAAGKISDILPISLNLIKKGGFSVIWQNLQNLSEIKKTKEPDFIYNYFKENDLIKRALFVFKK